MGIRIQDIAEAAGVSIAAVSLALNDKAGVGSAKRALILDTAKRLGYRSPRLINRKREGHSALCFLHIARHGHIVNRDHDVFIMDYISGLSQECEEQGYRLEIVHFQAGEWTEILQFAQESQASGLIILGTELSQKETFDFKDIPKPIVFIDAMHKYLNFDFVDMNNEDIVHALIQELVHLGHQSIGMVAASPDSPNLRLRQLEFRETLRHMKLPWDPSFLFTVDPTFQGAYEGMLEHLEAGSQLPTALFCANDIIAAGCLRALAHKGIQVPHDLSVIGFDDLPLASICEPPLTTIRVDKEGIGRNAVRLLVDRIEGTPSSSSVKVLVGGELIRRESVRSL
ncbi:MAG: LacI family DNA-binding transcriptional regulator [Spirochaetales bacterium]|nr:LacI family DNA-binding transcriptional regulator [Spirochaetales bacterium]